MSSVEIFFVVPPIVCAVTVNPVKSISSPTLYTVFFGAVIKISFKVSFTEGIPSTAFNP